MLDQVDELGLAHGSSWVSEGCAFAIHDPEVFMNDVSPKFFDKQTHLRSFHRQLSIWGFTRLETGAGGRGVWFHKHFIRDKPELIKHIKRVPVKNPKPALSTPKNRVPDYTNYQLPSSVDSTAMPPHFTAVAENSSVYQPHQTNAANVGVKGGLLETQFLSGQVQSSMPPTTSEGIGYLTALSRMPSAGSQGYPMNQVPPNISDQAQRYPPFILGGYQPSMVPSIPPMNGLSVPSMNGLSGPPMNGLSGPSMNGLSGPSMNSLPGYSSVNPNAPPLANNNNDLGGMVQQLLARRNVPPVQRSAGEGGADLNAVISMLMESRNKGSPSSNSNNGAAPAANEDLISAIARRGLI